MSGTEPSLAQLLNGLEAAIGRPGRNGLEPAATDASVEQLRSHPGLRSASPSEALRAARILSSVGAPPDLSDAIDLAAAARAGGEPGAGPVLAEATDKILLLQGMPQRFGTVMVEHLGDVVQPSVDPSTTDAERAEFGVPSMAEMEARMIEVGRRLARERAGMPGWLPPGQPFCRVRTDHTPEQLSARRESEGTSAWADGDILTFVTDADGPVAVAPTFPMATWDAGDGLQVLSVRVDRLNEAVLTYTFTPLDDPFGVARPPTGRSHDGRFRGPDAPGALPCNDPLKGSLTNHEVPTRSAPAGTRPVTVYRPPDHRTDADVPVVYATDGNMFAPYARRLDAAIESGACPPVVVVAAHAAPMTPTPGAEVDTRAAEYLMGFDPERFEAHQRFFVTDLARWAENELGVYDEPTFRGVLGCSDGAGHALAVVQLHPERFGHVFAFSTGMAPDPSTLRRFGSTGLPYVHLCAGTLEGPFHQATEAWAALLELADVPHHFTERVAGHDVIQ